MITVPLLHSYGSFIVHSPWTLPPLPHNCTQLRTIKDSDFADLYSPRSLSNATFKADVADQVTIVTLVSTTGITTVVPSSYITSFPDRLAISYSNTALLVDLGVQPLELDTLEAVTVCNDAIAATLGIRPVTTVTRTPADEVLSVDEHLTAELERRAAVVTDTSAAYTRSILDQVEGYKRRVRELELILIKQNEVYGT